MKKLFASIFVFVFAIAAASTGAMAAGPNCSTNQTQSYQCCPYYRDADQNLLCDHCKAQCTKTFCRITGTNRHSNCVVQSGKIHPQDGTGYKNGFRGGRKK